MADYGLTLSVAPTLEPLTLAEAREHGRIDGDDDDSYVLALITAARKEAESNLDRQLINATWDWTLDDFPESRGVLCPPLPPLVSVTSIVYDDQDGNSQTLAASKYTVDAKSEPGRIQPTQNETWPVTDDEMAVVTVKYVAGYGSAAEDVPQTIKHGMLVYINYLHKNRGDHDVNVLIGRGGIPDVVRRLWDAERWNIPH